MKDVRASFERWAENKPISLELAHFAVGPDEYGSYETEIAWQAYKAAHEGAEAEIAELQRQLDMYQAEEYNKQQEKL